MGTIFGIVIILLMVKEYFKLRRDRKLIKSKLNGNEIETDDLRIWSQSYSNVVVSFGKDFDYCKFCFADDEVYIFMRYSYPKSFYNGPFVLKANAESHYSYFTSCKINSFKINGSEMSIGFGHKGIIGSSHKFNIKNVSERDALLLKQYLS